MNVSDQVASRVAMGVTRQDVDQDPTPVSPAVVEVDPSDLHIPGYEILGVIREGGMGTVYRARQVSVDRIVAVKVLSDAYTSDEQFIERFRHESQSAARLSHPNIVMTLDAGEADGRPYLVMENVDSGATVKDFLARHGPFDEDAAIRIVLAVAEALREAHARGLIHRDVKPSNLILTPGGGVKLADLGLARSTDDVAWALSEAGMAVGTPEYISPEQVRGQIDLDQRSDLYSLGASFYQMLTGRVPYGGRSAAEALQRHVDPKVPWLAPDAFRPELSSGVCDVIRKLMARSRDDRYRNAEDLMIDLRNLLGGGRPIIADPSADALAALALGDRLEDDRRGDDPRTTVLTESPVPTDAETTPSGTLLLIVPALSLALALVVTVLLLVT